MSDVPGNLIAVRKRRDVKIVFQNDNPNVLVISMSKNGKGLPFR